MTRINLVDPSLLATKHLIAEYREITRLPGNLAKSLNRKTPFSFSEIPNEYTLGKGHVKFFYNKMLFLEKRFESLIKEMLFRNYRPKFQDLTIFQRCDKIFYNDFTPTKSEISLNEQRIKERS